MKLVGEIPKTNFLEELSGLINKYSIENVSNTPDFILAQYIESCLNAFATAVQQRETHYDRDARQKECVTITKTDEKKNSC